MNYMLDELERTVGKCIKKINKSGFVKMSMKSPKREHEKELYTPSDDYTKCAILTNIDNDGVGSRIIHTEQEIKIVVHCGLLPTDTLHHPAGQ